VFVSLSDRKRLTAFYDSLRMLDAISGVELDSGQSVPYVHFRIVVLGDRKSGIGGLLALCGTDRSKITNAPIWCIL